MSLISTLAAYLESLAQKIPVTLFVFIGGLLEEIVAPIPSPLVMVLAGTALKTQNKGVLYLLFIIILGSFAKTLGCWVWYFLTDKAEDIVLNRFGKYIGVSHKEVEGIGKHFKGGKKDFFVIFLGRAIPVMPSTPISVIAGLLKLDLKKFLLATFLGNIVRSSMFMYLGYVGYAASTDLFAHLDSIESVIQLLIGAALLGVLVWVYKKRNSSEDPLKSLLDVFSKKSKN